MPDINEIDLHMAYMAGCYAWRDGANLSNNPYTGELAEAWADGYIATKFDYEGAV